MAGIICSYANNCIPSNPLIRCKISNAYFPYFNQSHDSLHLLHCICYAFSVRPLSSHRNIDTYLNIMGSGMLHSSSSLCPQMKKLPQISILSSYSAGIYFLSWSVPNCTHGTVGIPSNHVPATIAGDGHVYP